MIVLANAGLPGYVMLFYMAALCPVALVAALAVEVAVFRWFNPGTRLLRLTAVVLAANGASSVASLLLVPLLPYSMLNMAVNKPLTPMKMIWAEAIGSIFVALALSILIEYWVICCLQRWIQLQKLFWCVVLANIASYITLVIMALASVKLGLYWAA